MWVGCVYCGAPLSLIAALLLFVMAGMLRRGSWTFAVIAQKHKWDVTQKARCCIHAAIFYLCISVLLWLVVLVDCCIMDLHHAYFYLQRYVRKGESPTWRELLQARHGVGRFRRRLPLGLDLPTTARAVEVTVVEATAANSASPMRHAPLASRGADIAAI